MGRRPANLTAPERARQFVCAKEGADKLSQVPAHPLPPNHKRPTGGVLSPEPALGLQLGDTSAPKDEATLETECLCVEGDQVGLLHFGACVRVHRDDVFLGGGED